MSGLGGPEDGRKLRAAAVGLAACVLAACACLALVVNWALTPVRPFGPPRLVTVPSGATAREIGGVLYSAGLVKHPLLFELAARAKRAGNKLVAGEYEMRVGLPVGGIVDLLLEGRIRTFDFTIPEGLTAVQVARTLEDSGFASSEEFLSACRSLGLNADHLPEGAGSLAEPMEGYLFPDTYRVARGTEPAGIVGLMYKRWEEAFDEARRSRAGELGMTIHQVLTLASIIEREAREPEERGLISGVFHNRLKLGMKLDADPTILYALGEPGGDLTLDDLQIDSPYNTYRYAGLPPGPICNPGAACIDAALYPEDTRYLYFVARNDGTHDFSVTLSEHLAKKRVYQPGRKGTG